MNENIDLTKILKNCPKGTELWSDNYGKVQFLKIEDTFKPIITIRTDGLTAAYTKEGWHRKDFPANCLLWPSRDCRDWSKFTAPWYNREESIKPKFKVGDIIRHKETNKNDVYKISQVYNDSYGIVGFNCGIYIKYQDQYELVPNKFDPKTLKPFDRVLIRDFSSLWKADLFSHYDPRKEYYPSRCVGNGCVYCIPYNDDTKHLIGTTNEAPEFYRYWED